jgi:hypothetical protein
MMLACQMFHDAGVMLACSGRTPVEFATVDRSVGLEL